MLQNGANGGAMTGRTGRVIDRAARFLSARTQLQVTPPEAALHAAVPELHGAKPARRRRHSQLLGERLVASGALDPGDLVRALALQTRQDARLGEILITHRMVAEEALMSALCSQWSAHRADLVMPGHKAEGIDAVGAERCLEAGIVPLARVGGAWNVATARPERFAGIKPELEAALGPVVMTLATEAEVTAAIADTRGAHLALRAEHRTPAQLSCRGWRPLRAERVAMVGLGALICALIAAPVATLWVLTALALLVLVGNSTLKGAALAHAIRRDRARAVPEATASPPPTALKLPVISVLVPLFEEADVAGKLVTRLERLRYPHELTDVVLLVEAGDTTTARALAQTRLPRFMRTLMVPPGAIQTKPRALNYGLSFCRGQIVGIWDAEDAPEPDQLHKVAARFARRGADVACLQGRLGFYNARTNWMSRCFTLEYGAWFHAVLPGLEALDLPIPLGGTTLFFRRPALEALGGWDAHNVTEDADLGIRLYRAGFRTETLDTETLEEANCRLLPWIRQRSRWLKGYAVTYAVHMRRPGRLWRELGPRGFIGFQTMFLGALTHFVLAPVVLSFWLLLLGLGHPLAGHVPAAIGWGMLALFVVAEAISMGLVYVANRRSPRAGLLPWMPLLHLYFPLATAAAYKGLGELLTQPFYWDKTPHGLHDEEPKLWPLGRGREVSHALRLGQSPAAVQLEGSETKRPVAGLRQKPGVSASLSALRR